VVDVIFRDVDVVERHVAAAERGEFELLAQAVLCAAHGRLAERREWVLNEKRLVSRAGLDEVQARLGAAGTTAAELEATVAAVSAALGVAPLAAR